MIIHILSTQSFFRVLECTECLLLRKAALSGGAWEIRGDLLPDPLACFVTCSNLGFSLPESSAETHRLT